MLCFVLHHKHCKEVVTFCYIQYTVYDGAKHLLDVAHYTINAFICSTEDISAHQHRVHEAKIYSSWEDKDM